MRIAGSSPRLARRRKQIVQQHILGDRCVMVEAPIGRRWPIVRHVEYAAARVIASGSTPGWVRNAGLPAENREPASQPGRAPLNTARRSVARWQARPSAVRRRRKHGSSPVAGNCATHPRPADQRRNAPGNVATTTPATATASKRAAKQPTRRCHALSDGSGCGVWLSRRRSNCLLRPLAVLSGERASFSPAVGGARSWSSGMALDRRSRREC